MFKVITDYPIAVDSPDHLDPKGTANDNHRNCEFNKKLYRLIAKTPLSILDLGCAGGGFVKDCIDDGHNALGLEGSDYSLKNKRAEWATIPNNLFTCDITKEFKIEWNNNAAHFDFITAWEFIEHVTKQQLNQVFTNVWSHLIEKGLFILTVGVHIDGPHHQIIEQPDWWYNRFNEFGWVIRQDLVEYFYSDWVRRSEPPSKIVEGKLVDKNGFHVILQKC